MTILPKLNILIKKEKIFLTKLFVPEIDNQEDFTEEFLTIVLESIKERNINVVPTSPVIAKFIRRHRKYKAMLPVGIRI